MTSRPRLLQDLEHRHPVDAGGLHGHGLDAQRQSQSAIRCKITGEGLERLHRFVAELRRNGNDMESRANIDAGRAVVDDGQSRRLACDRLDMIISSRLNTPDGDSDQITFLNGVTRGATTAGSAASPGPGFLTGIMPPKSCRPQSMRDPSVGTACFYAYGAREPAGAVF